MTDDSAMMREIEATVGRVLGRTVTAEPMPQVNRAPAWRHPLVQVVLHDDAARTPHVVSIFREATTSSQNEGYLKKQDFNADTAPAYRTVEIPGTVPSKGVLSYRDPSDYLSGQVTSDRWLISISAPDGVTVPQFIELARTLLAIANQQD